MHASLLILAAGMGSRYGGLKQLDPMGPNGETILDYTVDDAIRSGFSKIVFVIRQDFAEAFQSRIIDKFAGRAELGCVYQKLSDLPEGCAVPENREKPWGTAHALWAAREAMDTPFGVVNADDFYGAGAYDALFRHLTDRDAMERYPSCTVGYFLENTLSEHGPVNRGICRVENGELRGVEEHVDIARSEDGHIYGKNTSGQCVELAPDAITSMNCWGFGPAFFTPLEEALHAFLRTRGTEPKAECYIPSVVDDLIAADRTTCAVLETDSHWFGVTYPEDKPAVQAFLRTFCGSRKM
ncbi:MAG: NDP-sugar synthase [Opitutales bacterium]